VTPSCSKNTIRCCGSRRLTDAGCEVLGYDPVAGKAAAAGAIPADSVADAGGVRLYDAEHGAGR
jgi:hypothetical protein